MADRSWSKLRISLNLQKMGGGTFMQEQDQVTSLGKAKIYDILLNYNCNQTV